MKRFLVVLLSTCLLLSFFVFNVTAANLDNPSPANDEDAVFTSLCYDGVNVTLEISWTGIGTKDIEFYWGNHTLIGTDTSVSSGTIASLEVNELSFATSYSWYTKTSDGSDTSSTYSFTTSDVFVIQRNDPSVTEFSWIKTPEPYNPTLPIGGSGWDSVDKEGTTAFYDNVSERFVILYGGADGDPAIDGYDGIGVCYANSVSELRNPGSGGYERSIYNPVITTNMEKYTGGALGIYDDRDISGKVILLSKCTPGIWYNDDGNWSNWTYDSSPNQVLDDVEKINGMYIGLHTTNSPDTYFDIYYSDNPIDGWVPDNNNHVFCTSQLQFGSSTCTGQIFTLCDTDSPRVYVSFETFGDSSVEGAGGAVAYCNIGDLTDGDNSSTWYAGNNGYEFGVGGTVNLQSWECTTGWATCEHKTFYFPEGDPTHVYMFFESQCASWSQVGTAYTAVYGIDVDEEPSSIQFTSINGEANNTILQDQNRTFNWSKVNDAVYYQLQISNSSAFGTTFVNLANINETNYGVNYTETGDYIEFILPTQYDVEWYGYHYYRVRAYTT